MSTSKDYLNRSRRELSEYIKGDINFRIEHYSTHFAHAICLIQKFFRQHPEINYCKMDVLNLDILYSDIKIIPFYDSNKQLSYCRLIEAMKLTLPTCNYKIVNHQQGLYRDLSTNIVKYSKLVAIDFMLISIARRWLSEISDIQKSFK